MAKILGIHDGHTATAALIDNGRLAACVSEERLNRKKYFEGLPVSAVKWILSYTKTAPAEIDLVVFSYRISPLTRELFATGEYAGKFRIYKAGALLNRILPGKIKKSNLWVDKTIALLERLRSKKEIYSFFENIGIPKEKIIFADHHACHVHSTFLFGQHNLPAVILTCDGAGDGYSSTVSMLTDKEFKTIAKTNLYSSIGWFYARAAQYFGMQPLADEYKLMGLAGYASLSQDDRALGILRNSFFRLNPENNLVFDNLSGCIGKDYLAVFHRRFEDRRFDRLAGAFQKFFEELMTEWVKAAVKKTKIANLRCSGGAFMNVISNMKIMYESGAASLSVFPTPSDESCATGAAVLGYKMICEKLGIEFGLKKLEDVYLGPEYSGEYIERVLSENPEAAGLHFEKVGNPEKLVAEKLAEGKIVGIARGRLEYGARALGNRSILADPRSLLLAQRLNRKIKNRDFWMPFGGTMLRERERDYLLNEKRFPSPFMMLAFKTKENALRDIPAMLHAGNGTCRAQLLEKSQNPFFHDVIKNFESLTGIGAVLNTSFNAHGEPVVCSPEDAIRSFKSMGLDFIVLGNYAAEKKDR